MNRINQSATRLFELWCEVEKVGSTTSVTRSFPETFRDEKVLNAIGDFAFPCEFEKTQVLVYSFVITDIGAQWRFGFCRHDTSSNKATVIVTSLPWHDQFMKYINRLVEVKNKSPHDFQRFLSETYAVGIPEPGATVTVFAGTTHAFTFEMPWDRELPSIPGNHNLSVYYSFVEPETMIDVFCAMLNERRIIFTSQRLEVLSSCILAAADLIYPMTWQHIYIPVLPMKLKEYVNAPMPYLIGVAKPVLQAIRPDELTDVVLLDCDNKRFESQFHDDKKSLPKEVLDGLRKNLNNPARQRGDCVSRTFLRAIVQLIGGYRDGLKFGDAITFDDNQFLEARSPRLRPFLKNILELQLFRQFIDERLISMKDGFSDEFEKEIRLYSEKVSKRKFKIIHNLKEKTNPAISSAMQSAKEGGRGVKTVYKGLKSKIREAKGRNSIAAEIQINSPPNSPEMGQEVDELDYSTSSNEHLDDRPSLSLSSSPLPSRSSMNILNELVQEGVLRRPEISHDLKPKQSIKPLTLSPNITNTSTSGRLSSRSTSSSNSDNNNSNTQQNSTTIEKPPILKPMVPPRPKNLLPAPPFPLPPPSHLHKSQKLPVPTSSSSALVSPHGDGNDRITLPDNAYDPFVRLCAEPPTTQAPPLPPTLPPRRSQMLQTMARQDFFNNAYEQWQIKGKNSVNGGDKIPKSRSDDLIKLDDSLDLDDFDPLNAKNVTVSSPSTSSRSESSSVSMLPSAVVGFSNPVYTFGDPPRSTATLNLLQSERSESLELLSKYGLDQYTLLANGHIDKGIGPLSSVATSDDAAQPHEGNGGGSRSSGKNWTTFE